MDNYLARTLYGARLCHPVFGSLPAVRLPSGETGILTDRLAQAFGRVSEPCPYYGFTGLLSGNVISFATQFDGSYGYAIVVPSGLHEMANCFRFTVPDGDEMAHDWIDKQIVPALWGEYDTDGVREPGVKRLTGYPDHPTSYGLRSMDNRVHGLAEVHAWRCYQDRCVRNGKKADWRFYTVEHRVSDALLSIYEKEYDSYERDGWDMDRFIPDLKAWYENWTAACRAAGLIPDPAA